MFALKNVGTFLKNILIFILSHYALNTLFLKKSPCCFKNKLIKILVYLPRITLTVLLTILSVVISVLVLTFFSIYKNLVRLLLKIRYKSNFAGLITGCDFFVLLKPKTEDKGWINGVILFRSDENEDVLYREIIERIWEQVTQTGADKRWMSIRQKSLGYLFHKKIVFECHEFFKKISSDKITLTREEFMECISKYSNGFPLPRNNGANWDIHFVSTPLETNEFGILFRVHHSLMDGFAFYNTVSSWISKPNIKKQEYVAKQSKGIENKKRSKFTIKIHSDPFIKLDDYLIDNLETENDILVYFCETSGTDYIKKVKEIKNQAKVPFIGVLMATFSAALYEFYAEKVNDVPETIKVGGPIQMKPKRFKKLYADNVQNKLSNDFTIISYNLPLKINQDKCDLLERLKIISDEMDAISNSFDAQLPPPTQLTAAAAAGGNKSVANEGGAATGVASGKKNPAHGADHTVLAGVAIDWGHGWGWGQAAWAAQASCAAAAGTDPVLGFGASGPNALYCHGAGDDYTLGGYDEVDWSAFGDFSF